MLKQNIPQEAAKYFWGDSLDDLDLEKNKKYIIQTILEKGDAPAVKWLFSVIDKETIRKFLDDVQLSEKSSTFWKIYLS